MKKRMFFVFLILIFIVFISGFVIASEFGEPCKSHQDCSGVHPFCVDNSCTWQETISCILDKEPTDPFTWPYGDCPAVPCVYGICKEKVPCWGNEVESCTLGTGKCFERYFYHENAGVYSQCIDYPAGNCIIYGKPCGSFPACPRFYSGTCIYTPQEYCEQAKSWAPHPFTGSVFCKWYKDGCVNRINWESSKDYDAERIIEVNYTILPCDSITPNSPPPCVGLPRKVSYPSLEDGSPDYFNARDEEGNLIKEYSKEQCRNFGYFPQLFPKKIGILTGWHPAYERCYFGGECCPDADSDGFTSCDYPEVGGFPEDNDCDDYPLDDPDICWFNYPKKWENYYEEGIYVNGINVKDMIDCSNSSFSKCAKCKNTDAKEICNDNIDNNCDGVSASTTTREVCNNGIDDNCDNLIDCEDTTSCPPCTECKFRGKCYGGKCEKDKDRDGFISVGIGGYDAFDSQKICLGDCDDDKEKDPLICKETIDCANEKYSICAKCINPNAKEICDGVDNDCKGKCEGKVAGENFGEKECSSSLDCQNLELYGPHGAENGNGYCQMADENINVGGQVCSGLSQCVKSGEYIEEVEPETRKIEIIVEILYGANSKIEKREIDITNNKLIWIFQPADNKLIWSPHRANLTFDAKCGKFKIWETEKYGLGYGWEEYNTLVINKDWEPFDCLNGFYVYGSDCRFRYYELNESCLPDTEKIIGENPDGGNLRGWYDYFVNDNRNPELYPSEEIMKTIQWITSCAIKDKCTDNKDNDGEESLNIALFDNYGYLLPGGLTIKLIPVCCNISSENKIRWEYNQRCLSIRGEVVDDTECTGTKPPEREINLQPSYPLKLKDVDDPDCHHDSEGNLLNYCLDEDNDRYCGCIRLFADVSDRSFLSDFEIGYMMSSCNSSVMSIKGYTADKKPVNEYGDKAYLESTLFPDCDDNPKDDNFLESFGGYRYYDSGGNLRTHMLKDFSPTPEEPPIEYEINASFVHPFQRIFLASYFADDTGIGSQCLKNVKYIDYDCNKNYDDETKGLDLSFLSGGVSKDPRYGVQGDRLISEGTSPYDYNRLTGVDRVRCLTCDEPFCKYKDDNVDFFCYHETINEIQSEIYSKTAKQIGLTIISVGGMVFIIGPAIAPVAKALPTLSTVVLGVGAAYHSYGAIKGGIDCIKSFPWDLETTEICADALGHAGWGYIFWVGAVKSYKLATVTPNSWLANSRSWFKTLFSKQFIEVGGVGVYSKPEKILSDGTIIHEVWTPYEEGKSQVMANQLGSIVKNLRDVEPKLTYKGKLYQLTNPWFQSKGTDLHWGWELKPYVEVGMSEEVFQAAANTLARVSQPLSTSYQPLDYPSLASAKLPIPSELYNEFGNWIYIPYPALTAPALPAGECAICGPEKIAPALLADLTEGILPPEPELACAEKCPITPGCFLAGTKILLANGSYMNIEDIKEGEEVIAYDLENNRQEKVKVTKTFEREVNEYLIIEYEN